MIDLGSRLVRRGDYIWGSFVRPPTVDGWIVGANPGDRDDVLGRFAFTLTSVDDAVGAAREGLTAWSDVVPERRAAVLERYAELVEEAGEALAVLITRETGKSLWEARAEVAATARGVRMLVSDGLASLQPLVLRADVAWSERRPLGVVAVITPWTWPLLLPSLHVLAAMLAGNTVVYKPSKYTPGVGQAVAELLDRCRLPRGAFNLVQGSGSSVGARLAAHPGIDALVFTGSHDTAVRVRQLTASRPELPTFFQCGGKSAALVLDGANLELAAYELAVSAAATAGQRHDATARLFVTRGHFDVFVERLVERLSVMVFGYGFDPGVFAGPMISDSHRRRFKAWLADLEAAGHTSVVDGGPWDHPTRRGYYVRPAVHWVTREEVLEGEPPGPVVQVYCVHDADHAIALHEQLEYRVSTAIFAGDERHAADVSRQLSTGAVFVNRGTSTTSLRLPAVGRGRSTNAVVPPTELVRQLTVPQALLVDRRPYDETRFVPGAGALPAAREPRSAADRTGSD